MTAQFSRRFFLLGSAASGLALTGCGRYAMAAPERSETAHVRAIYDSTFEGMLRTSPEMATGLGLDSGERGYLKARLGTSSPAGKMGLYRPLLEQLPQLRAIERTALPQRERYWYDTVLWLGERMENAATIPYGAVGGYNYPVPYVISQLTGSYQWVPDFLDSQHAIETAADAEAYLSRLDEFARNVNFEVDRMRIDAGQGVIPPVYILDKALAQTRNLRGPEGQAGLVDSLVRRAREKGIAGDWERRAREIVEGRLAAALDRQIEALQGLRPRAGTSPAVTRLPQGGEFYRTALRYHTSTALSPEELHRIGLAQVEEISAELDVLLRREGLTEGAVGARLTALGDDPRYLYPDTAEGRERLLADLRAQMEAIRAKMPAYFNTIPTAPMEVKRVPPAIEAGAPRGYAQAPSLDGSRPGAYYINLADTRMWPKWALPTLTYHESIPGHLWQAGIVLENDAIPLLHRNIGVPAYGEGWGLYSEQLADEVSMYADFPQGRIGMLQAFLYRAARIVLDTGMHAMGWSRDRAIAYFREQVGLDPRSAESEVDRYVVWPGQAVSYKVGHNEIVRLREEAKAALGPRFDIKGFHDAVLLQGDLPLEVLATVVADWVASRS